MVNGRTEGSPLKSEFSGKETTQTPAPQITRGMNKRCEKKKKKKVANLVINESLKRLGSFN